MKRALMNKSGSATLLVPPRRGGGIAALGALSARGFTLVELAVVMATIVTLATLALPYYGDTMARQRLKAAAENLALDLAEARQEAARLGAPVHVSVRAGPDWCWAITTTQGCSCRAAAPCRIKPMAGSSFAGIALVSGKDLSFDPAGSGTPSSTRLQTLKGEVLVVTTTALGRARICAPQAMPGYASC